MGGQGGPGASAGATQDTQTALTPMAGGRRAAECMAAPPGARTSAPDRELAPVCLLCEWPRCAPSARWPRSLHCPCLALWGFIVRHLLRKCFPKHVQKSNMDC